MNLLNGLQSFFLAGMLLPSALSLCSQHSCLVSQYNFSGNANDSKGNNHGTVNGATLTTDRYGNANSAYEFVASEGDNITIPHTPFFFPNYSYSVWIKLASAPPAGNAYIFLSIGGTGGDQNMQVENNQDNFTLGYLTGFSLTAYNINGNLRNGTAVGTLPNNNQWYHVVCTRDTNYFKIYVNGCLVKTSNHTNGSLPFYGTSGQSAKIGARSNNSRNFNGVMDEVGIYSCALSAYDVSRLYTSYKPFKASPDTSFCLPASPFRLKASPGYCSYRWIDSSKRSTILGTDSQLQVNLSKSTTFRVFNQLGDSATVRITILKNKKVNLGRDTQYCLNFSAVLDAGDSAKSYQWNNGGTSRTKTVNTLGTHIVQVDRGRNCISRDTLIITEKTPLKIDIGPDTSFCGVFTNVLRAPTGGSVYLWTSGVKSDTIHTAMPGIYAVSVTYSDGCISRDTMQISQYPEATINLGPDTTLCDGRYFFIGKEVPGTFEWNTGSPRHSITVGAAGTYWVKYTDTNGCTARDTFILSYYPQARARFSVSPQNAPVDKAMVKISNLAVNSDSLRYELGDGYSSDSLAPWHRYTSSGKYIIRQFAYTENGCNDTFGLEVFFYEDYAIHIPTAFSPNQNGTNEVFKPFLSGYSSDNYELSIFDRWGGMLFTTTDPEQGWDGMVKGETVPDGVYIYILKLRTSSRKIFGYSGTFTLLR